MNSRLTPQHFADVLSPVAEFAGTRKIPICDAADARQAQTLVAEIETLKSPWPSNGDPRWREIAARERALEKIIDASHKRLLGALAQFNKMAIGTASPERVRQCLQFFAGFSAVNFDMNQIRFFLSVVAR